MPLLVYATGKLTLGPYSRGGAGRFLADFLRSLARLEWQALALALAPLALVLAWRVIRALRAPRRAMDTWTPEAARDAPCAANRLSSPPAGCYCEAAPPARLWSRMARNSLSGRQFGKPSSIASISPTSK